MSTAHSPQRSRKPQILPSSSGTMHGIQPRENSPSPFREKQRAVKAQSMPLVPSAAQMFAVGQQAFQGQQSSPTSSNPSRRSPPMQSSSGSVQIQRLLPTPPHPNPPTLHDQSPERRLSPGPSPPQLQSNVGVNVNTHYPRPINRVPPPQFLSKFHELEERWQMTDELMAEIERADMQQAQGLAAAASHPYPPLPSSGGHAKSDSPAARDHPVVERVRATERASPKDLDGGQLGRRPSIKDSPKSRDRSTTSPMASSFSPNQSQTPERRVSPVYHSPLGSPGEHYAQYHHDTPPLMRRPQPGDGGRPTNLSLATQTPPLQAINARTPDKSLPVQEEPEDDNIAVRSKNGVVIVGSREHERYLRQNNHDSPPMVLSSELIGEDMYPHGGRNSRAAHRDDDDDETLFEKTDKPESSSNEGGFTPRSPAVGLPPESHDRHGGQPINQSRGGPPVPATVRKQTRNGSMDQMGLRGLDTALFEQVEHVRSELPPQYVEPPRKAVQNQGQRMQDSYAQYYHTQQIHPDDFIMDDPTSAYIQAYLRSPRPDAPIPPTPHSQTAPPSPSPLISGHYDSSKELPPFSPIVPAGSPYPYPFSHVRRNQSYSGTTNRSSQHPANVDLNHPAVIQEQFAKQWQMYAQNNNGNVTESTFTPSSTPFPGSSFNPWAYWHTQRLMGGRIPGSVTTRSSPSHEPIQLPIPPMVGLRKKMPSMNLRAQSNGVRKPPPRVESTQPRETSPEPSTSGEETAGEEQQQQQQQHYAVSEEGNWVNGHVGGIAVPIAIGNGNGDESEWVDEDDEDEEDLLELEYHPSYVSNVEKRRRRWETRWDALLQAFQTLDRQTDATMVLLAAPSHTTKLHMVTSRSIRRQPTIGQSPPMNNIRTGFRQVAAQRKSSRSHKASLIDRFLVASGGSGGDGSDGSSSESREEDLRRALDSALGSLNLLGNMYEQREARWVDEMRRVSEDRERVELLLRQVLGERRPSESV